MTAFTSRFAIGFLVAFVKMPIPAFAIGALVGLLVSIPDAIITKAYIPILAIGIVGRAIIGWVSCRTVA